MVMWPTPYRGRDRVWPRPEPHPMVSNCAIPCGKCAVRNESLGTDPCGNGCDLRFREHLDESDYDHPQHSARGGEEQATDLLRPDRTDRGRLRVGDPASLKNLFKRLYGVSMREWRESHGAL